MIKVSHLTKYYGQRIALDDVSFEVGKGECVGFLGRNGAGKTTALKVLATVLLPSSGDVHVGGHNVVESPDEVRRLIGFLPEDPPLYKEMTPRGYLRYLGALRGMPEASLDKRIDTVAGQTDISGVLDEAIETLSLGYRKRVGLAQAIVHEPELVIVDEPISGLDPVQIVEIRELLRSLRGKHTILLSSHILTELSQTCDRFLVIDRGRIVGSGSETELLQNAKAATSFVVNVEVRGSRDAFDGAAGAVSAAKTHRVTFEDGEVIQAQFELDADVPEAVAAAMVGAGLKLRALTSRAADLESIFVELTGKKEAA